MKDITTVNVYSNRIETEPKIFTVGDKNIPHLLVKFFYKFNISSLKNKKLECSYHLPNKELYKETLLIQNDDFIEFPIHYSTFINPGWTSLVLTIIDGDNRMSFPEIILKTKGYFDLKNFEDKLIKKENPVSNNFTDFKEVILFEGNSNASIINLKDDFNNYKLLNIEYTLYSEELKYSRLQLTSFNKFTMGDSYKGATYDLIGKQFKYNRSASYSVVYKITKIIGITL
ncbi:hypothetical protein [Cetobacterium ceti]